MIVRTLMPNRQRSALKAIAVMMMATFGLQAQSMRADLTARDTAGIGKQCLDLTGLKGKTLTVPPNVTRLDNQGFAECTKADTTTAGIVFIVDQSSSMDFKNTKSFAYIKPAVGPTPADTFYYQDNTGCPAGSTTDGAGSNTNGTLQVGSIFVYLLKSNAGCIAPSGDPFQIREAAVSRAIDTISRRPVSSTIGYLPFAQNVLTGSQRPLVVNTPPINQTNINTLKNKLILQSSGGTVYDRPIDSAVRWLNTSAITPTLNAKSTRAIVFISDGATSPADSDGTRFVDPTIPIYGIFLGKLVTPDTANLLKITDLTRPTNPNTGLKVPPGSDFFRVSPSDTAGLVKVIQTILNRIIKVYVPHQVVIRDSVPGFPNQSSIATGAAAFGNQGGTGASWRIQLDSVLALKPGVSNSIRIISNLKTTPDSTIANLNDTTQFTVNFSTTPSDGSNDGKAIVGSTNLTTKTYPATTLQWLTSSGLRPTSFNETDAQVQLQLNTSKNGLANAFPIARAIVGPPPQDSLRANLPRGTDSLHYTLTIPIGYGSAVNSTPANTTLETKLADTLTARWVHPRDPQDVARDTLSIRPANKNSFIYFSSHANGDTVITRFDTTTANPNIGPVYIIVRDQRAIPGKPVTVKITTLLSGFDQETVTLAEQVTPPPGALPMPGFSFFNKLVTVAKTSKNSGDTIVEYAAKGDQMAASYTDPVNGSDAANCNAGINQNAKPVSFLQFVDSTEAGIAVGNNISLPADRFWSLGNNKVYLKYQASIKSPASVPVQITAITSKVKKTIVRDSETVTMGSKKPLTNDVSTWLGNIGLIENISPVKLNGTLQGSYRIDVIATAPDYDSLGAPTGVIDTAKLVVAWPDSLSALSYLDTVNATDSLGPVSVILTLSARDFVHNQPNDTVTASVLCTGASADSVPDLRFIQVSKGKYVSETLVRNLSTPSLTDRILSCPADSGVVVRYFDPVYQTAYPMTLIQTPTPQALPPSTVFATDNLPVDLIDKDPLAQIYYTRDGSFPRPGQASPSPSGTLQMVGISNSLKAVALNPGLNHLRSRVISELYLKQPKLLKSYAKDRNRDGQADAVYLLFAKTIPTNFYPVLNDSIYWNEEIPANQRTSGQSVPAADSVTLSFLNMDPFAKYLTGIPTGTTHPAVAKFPLGGYFNGLRAVLEDSVGPVPKAALKSPSDLRTGSTDTLLITVSEKLAPAILKRLFRFRSGSCGDLNPTQTSFTIPVNGDGVFFVNDTTYRVEVNNTPGVATPQNGDCILLETDGTYKDTKGNLPGLLGVVLSGGESKKIVSAMDGFPPVAGLDPTSRAYALANNSDGSRSHVSGTSYKWVQPFDFPATWTKGDKYTPVVNVKNVDDTTAVQTITDKATPTAIPTGLGTVQIVASTRYIAHVHLSDHTGRFIKSWKQQFGFNSERSNGYRPTDGGSLSYLVWDGHDTKGQVVGDGVYIWKVNFDLPNGKSESYVTRTGWVK